MDNFYSEDDRTPIPVRPQPLIDIEAMPHRNMGMRGKYIFCKCGFKCTTQTQFNKHIASLERKP